MSHVKICDIRSIFLIVIGLPIILCHPTQFPGLSLLGGLALVLVPPVYAQSVSPLDAELERFPDEPLELPELPSRQLPQLEIPIPTPGPEATPLQNAVYVTEFRFYGNTVFTDEELATLAAPYLNRMVTFGELRELSTKITNLYIEQGYRTSAAIIPEQYIQDLDENAPSIAIQILEGQVEELLILGDKRLADYVRARLERSIRPVLNQSELEEALWLLQFDPLIQTISGNLSPGSQINRSILTIQVDGEPPFSVRASVDNSRSPTVGTLQVEGEIESANVTGNGEVFSATYGFTEGSNRGGLEFSIPVNRDNGAIALRYANLNGQIVESPFDELDIELDSRIYELSYRQPVVRRADGASFEELALGISAARLESESTIEGFPFPLSEGADAEGKTRVSELSFAQEYRAQNSQSVLLSRSDFSFGLDLFDATSNEEGADAQYFLWNGQVAWLQRVLGDAVLLVRGDIQLTPDSLVPFAQFGLSGNNSVRGYREGAVISDNGIVGRVELQVPLLEQGNARLDLIPSFAAGVGWNNGSDRALDENVLAAPGLGLELELGDFLARLDYAISLTDVGFEGESFQETGFSFLFEYQKRF